MTSPDRSALVAAARADIAAGSKSFAAASRLFDRTTRERVWLLYAWCRACDDIADGQDMGGTMAAVEDAPARLARIEALTDAAYVGHATGVSAFDGFALLLREVPMPRVLADDLLAGFRLDCAGWAPETGHDLMQYCYHVAGVVGRMMLRVMAPGASDDVELAAMDLGLSFQLSNIARDIAEDAAAERCYLPRAWLAEAGIAPEEVMAPRHRPALVAIVRRMAKIGAEHDASARWGAAHLPWRSRWAVLAATGIYGDIMAKVVEAGPAAWDARVHTTGGEKLRHLVRALDALDQRPQPTASGLWRPTAPA